MPVQVSVAVTDVGEAGRGDARDSPSLDKRRGFNPRHPGPQLSIQWDKRPGLDRFRSSGRVLLVRSRSLAAPACASPLPFCFQNRTGEGGFSSSDLRLLRFGGPMHLDPGMRARSHVRDLLLRRHTGPSAAQTSTLHLATERNRHRQLLS